MWGVDTHPPSPLFSPQRVYTFVKGESDGGAEMKELVSMLCVCELVLETGACVERAGGSDVQV